MLTSLTVKNIVLVEYLELDLSKGLNVLTGETGAGKSILLDALGLVIGGRGDSNLVRNGTEKATVVASFEISENHPVWTILKELDIDADINENIILKRTISKDGKSRATINGVASTIKELRFIGDSLVDVQGQFDQNGLLNPAQHMYILDNFSSTDDLKKSVLYSFDDWKLAHDNYQSALSDYDKAQEDAEYIAHCLVELEEINPKTGEETDLLEAKSKLQNVDKLLQAYQNSSALIGGDNGADTNVRKAERLLEGIADVGGKEINNTLSNLIDISSQFQDIISTLEEQAYALQAGAQNLSNIDDRLHNLKDLAKKHRVSVDDLESVMVQMQKQNELLVNSDTTLLVLKDAVENTKKQYIKHAQDLSSQRQNYSVKLSKKVCGEMPTLGLSGAEFIIQVESLTDIDLQSASRSGIDTIRFMARMNAGSTFSPIHKSASGGELSRMLLAINVALAEKNTSVTLMFDEVDAGVGGKSANAIGARLQELSKSHQLFVITHSPQVAGAGHNHLFVSKSDVDGCTVSTIKFLDLDERTNEIARMLSGADITSEATANAKILLEKSNG